MKKLVGVLVVLFMVISFGGVAHAEDPQYVIGFKYVQQRTFENGKTVNRVAVGMHWNDGSGMVDANVVEQLWLYRLDDEENQHPMELTNVVIQDGIREGFPRFSTFDGPWWFPGWSISNYYIADIAEELVPGTTYVIEVKCYGEDGIRYIATVHFGEPANLPIVSSKSFKYEFDEDGNFYFHWDVPKGMFYLGPELLDRRPHVRAMLHFYNAGVLTDKIWVKIPYLMSGIFIPADWRIFDTEADYVEVGVEVRLQDSTYRTYSDYKELNKMP